MKKLLLSGFLLMGMAWAQDLVPLAPAGASIGLAVANLGQSPYLKNIGQDWARSGIETYLRRTIRDADTDPALLGIANGGLVAAFYPNGDFFILARPSAEALAAVRKETVRGQSRSGWVVSEEDDIVSGYSRDLVVIAAKAAFERFIRNQRGLRAPVSGDIVLWADVPRDLGQQLELPPRLSTFLAGLRRLSVGIRLTASGYTSETRLELNPSADPVLGRLLLPSERPWSLEDFPQGLSMSSGVFDIAGGARYLSRLLDDLGLGLSFDLSAFGNRFASVTFASPPTSANTANTADSLDLGSSLTWFEVKDPATAEANLLAVLQNAAAFASPDGEGGFRVLPDELGFKVVEVGLSGKVYYRLESGRLVVATSPQAIEGLRGRKVRENTIYNRLRSRVPANATSVTYSDQGQALKDSLGGFSDLLTLPIGDLGQGQETQELAKALENFFGRISSRFGAGLSYTVVEGNTLVFRDLVEVRW